MDKRGNYIIFANDKNYAYKLKVKLDTIGIHLQYFNELGSFINHLIMHSNSVVFIKTNSERMKKSLQQIFNYNYNGKHTIVYMEENTDNQSVISENQFIKVSNYDKVLELIPDLMCRISVLETLKSRVIQQHADKYITLVLNAMNIKPTLNGYLFIADCVRLLLGFGDRYYSILKDVYEEVAKKYNKDVRTVEKSIRFALNKSFEDNKCIYHCVFKKGNVTNSEFVQFVVSKVQFLYAHNFK